MQKLNRELYPELKKYPLKMLQFGGGNFLRGFIDWMLDALNGKGMFNGSVTVIKPTPSKRTSLINEQQGLYTVLCRGRENGWTVEKHRLVSCLNNELNPYENWQEFLELAHCDTLEFVCSNTTESGIVYAAEEHSSQQCPTSFPAKVTALLYERYTCFKGQADKGLIFLPCELIENNGDKLHECIIKYARNWNLTDDFIKWIDDNCYFCNTLVDSIVTGFPTADATDIFSKLGYDDQLLVACEPYNLFAIEADSRIPERLPLEQSGANVVWTDSLTPYRERKVKVLNGGHTGSILSAFLCGMDTVGEMMHNSLTSGMLYEMLFAEVLPTIDLPSQEKESFALAVLERFSNPFIRHELLAISLNSTSKWKVRVLPSIKDYYAKFCNLPKRLCFSLAALCYFYKASKEQDGTYSGLRDEKKYPIKDSEEACGFFMELWSEKFDAKEFSTRLLANTDLWGEDLNTLGNLKQVTGANLQMIINDGIESAIRKVCEDA